MEKTLIVIGEHKEEANYGKALREFMGNGTCEFAEFYEVRNAYPNHGKETEEQRRIARDEIMDIMADKYPTVTINVHTGEGHKVFSGIELMSRTEFQKMRKLSNVLLSREKFAKSKDKVYISRGNNFPGECTSISKVRESFPYIGFEHYLFPDIEKREPKREELGFAQKVIKNIAQVYENH